MWVQGERFLQTPSFFYKTFGRGGRLLLEPRSLPKKPTPKQKLDGGSSCTREKVAVEKIELCAALLGSTRLCQWYRNYQEHDLIIPNLKTLK